MVTTTPNLTTFVPAPREQLQPSPASAPRPHPQSHPSQDTHPPPSPDFYRESSYLGWQPCYHPISLSRVSSGNDSFILLHVSLFQTKQLTTVAWDAAGVSSRRSELATFAAEYVADIVLHCETYLTAFKRFSHSSDTCYAISPQTTTSHFLWWHGSLSPQADLPSPATIHIEACAVALCEWDVHYQQF